MYDLVPPNMKAQFNSISIPNQSIKLSVVLIKKNSNKKDFSDYTYNKNVIFKYLINIKNSLVTLTIYKQNLNNNHFNSVVLGSFVYQTAVKYSASSIVVDANNKLDLDGLIFGFLQKDFIYSIYKNNSKKSKYKTSYNLWKIKIH